MVSDMVKNWLRRVLGMEMAVSKGSLQPPAGGSSRFCQCAVCRALWAADYQRRILGDWAPMDIEQAAGTGGSVFMDAKKDHQARRMRERSGVEACPLQRPPRAVIGVDGRVERGRSHA